MDNPAKENPMALSAADERYRIATEIADLLPDAHAANLPAQETSVVTWTDPYSALEFTAQVGRLGDITVTLKRVDTTTLIALTGALVAAQHDSAPDRPATL